MFEHRYRALPTVTSEPLALAELALFPRSGCRQTAADLTGWARLRRSGFPRFICANLCQLWLPSCLELFRLESP